jgi:Methyltransferase domain
VLKLDGLPDSALVLDVGGWAETHPRADWVIDIGSFETRDWYRHTLRGEGGAPPPSRVSAATWVRRDICSSDHWPFEDGMFDYVICSHTLEDVRDPIRVCEEIVRVGRAGYVETPSAATELTRGVYSPHICGWPHHRWLVEREGDGLTFLGKPHHIHSPLWPSVRSPKLLRNEWREHLRFEWEGSFDVRELVLVDEHELDEHLLRIVHDAAQPDAVGNGVRRVLRAADTAYRSVRRFAGSARRR